MAKLKRITERHTDMGGNWSVERLATRLSELAEAQESPARLCLAAIAGSDDRTEQFRIASTAGKAIGSLNRLLSSRGLAVEYQRGTPEATPAFRVWRK